MTLVAEGVVLSDLGQTGVVGGRAVGIELVAVLRGGAGAAAVSGMMLERDRVALGVFDVRPEAQRVVIATGDARLDPEPLARRCVVVVARAPDASRRN